jgi:hypothetical protein
MGRAIRTFRCSMNKDYVKKGLTPFNDFGFIQNFQALSKKRKWHTNLGLYVYEAKIKEWRLKEQQYREVGSPDILEGASEHTWNWVFGWYKSTEDGQLVTKSSEVSKVLQWVKNLLVLCKEGKFKPNHQNDQLTATLQSDEHRGCIRVVSSMALCKEG